MRCRMSLVSTHRCLTFVTAARMPSTSPTYVRTRSRTTHLHTSVQHSTCSACAAILRSYALPNLIGTPRCPTFVRAARRPSTSLTCIRTRCRTSLVSTHHCLTFVSAARMPSTLPTYIRTRSRTTHLHTCVLHSTRSASAAILRSYVLPNLVGTHRCPTFVRAARMLSTSPTYVRTRSRTTHLHTSVLHSTRSASATILRSYALPNLVGTHRCPTFVSAASLPSISPAYGHTRCRTTLLCTSVLHSTCYGSAAITAGYIRTRCTYAVHIAELSSNVQQKHPSTHLCPTFHTLRVCRHSTLIRVAEPRWYAQLSHIRTCCS